jgi:HEAT repeat protein
MGEIKSPTSRAYLNSALRDPDKTVRVMVAGALAERNDERAARIIWGVIESPESPSATRTNGSRFSRPWEPQGRTLRSRDLSRR